MRARRIVPLLLCFWASCRCVEQAGPPPSSGSRSPALAVAKGFFRPPEARIPEAFLHNPGEPWGDYLGSQRCQPCHPGEHARWRKSYHSRTLYLALPQTVFGDFSGAVTFDDAKFAFRVRPFRRSGPDGREHLYMEVRTREDSRGNPDTYGRGIPERTDGVFEVLYAFGNRRHQPYVTRSADGKHWMLPVFWNDVTKQWRWMGYRPYVESCAPCHTTGIRSSAEPWRPGEETVMLTHPKRYNLPPGEEGWADGSVGCENCHGAGRTHVERVEELGSEAYRDGLRSGVLAPTIWDGKRGSPRHRAMVCGQCHNFFTENQLTWHPGPEGFDRDPRMILVNPGMGNKAQFYPDGSHRSPCTILQVYGRSAMARAGVLCGDCHDPHGTDHWADLLAPVEDNSLCISCHAEQFPDLAAETRHSRHLAGQPGNRCLECHMPRQLRFSNGVEIMSEQLPSHAFSIPNGEQAEGGPPPSCNICHVDRDSAWTRGTLAAWKVGREKLPRIERRPTPVPPQAD